VGKRGERKNFPISHIPFLTISRNRGGLQGGKEEQRRGGGGVAQLRNEFCSGRKKEGKKEMNIVPYHNTPPQPKRRKEKKAFLLLRGGLSKRGESENERYVLFRLIMLSRWEKKGGGEKGEDYDHSIHFLSRPSGRHRGEGKRQGGNVIAPCA